MDDEELMQELGGDGAPAAPAAPGVPPVPVVAGGPVRKKADRLPGMASEPTGDDAIMGELSGGGTAGVSGGPTPEQGPLPGDMGGFTAFVERFERDFPIIGPPLMKHIVDPASAAIRSKLYGIGYEEAAKQIDKMVKATEASHPKLSTAGSITGQVTGYAGAAALAPMAFGAGIPSMVTAAGVAGTANVAIRVADRYMRGEENTKEDIALTFGLGAVGGAVVSLFGKVLDPAIVTLADSAVREFKIPIQASKVSANPFITRLPKEIMQPGVAAATARSEAKTITGWYRAIAETLGEDAAKVDAKVLAAARARIDATAKTLLAAGSQASPALKAEQAMLREQNDLMKVLEQLMANNRQGNFTPQEFHAAAKEVLGDFAFGGGGKAGRLADIGVTFAKGTADPKMDAQTFWRLARETIGAAGVVGAHFLHGSPEVTGAMLAVPAAVARIGGFIGRRTSVGNYLIRQAMETPTKVDRFLTTPTLNVIGKGLPALLQQSKPLLPDVAHKIWKPPL